MTTLFKNENLVSDEAFLSDAMVEGARGNPSESEERGCKVGGALFEGGPTRARVSLSPGVRLQQLGLLNEDGKPRLNVAQGFFNRAENQDELELLEELFVYWRDLNEFLVLRSLQVNPRTMASIWSYVGVKCSKRGNDVYRRRVKRTLNWLSDTENVTFFEPKDFSVKKKVYSSALWLTLTYDVKRCSRAQAIVKVGEEWNRFLSGLRRKYGQISVLRTWETSEKGYPHIHAIVLFSDARFSVVPWVSREEGRFTYRIEEKGDIAGLWHSHVDIQAVNSTKKLFNYMRKYQTKTLMASDSPKGVKTMSLLWLFGKRSFSVSGDFRRRLSDLIRSLHNSNMVFRQSRLDGSLQDAQVWEFVGVFSGSELAYHGDRWSFKLDPGQVDVVLERESERRLGDLNA